MIPRKLFLSEVLSEVEKSLLWKGLNFSIRSKKLNHSDYLFNFELLHRDIRNLQVLSTEDLYFINTKTEDIAPFSFCTYNNYVPQHPLKGEFVALKNTQAKHTNRHSKV